MWTYWRDILQRVPHLLWNGIDRALGAIGVLIFVVGLYFQRQEDVEQWFKIHYVAPLAIAAFIVLHGLAKAIYEKQRELENERNDLLGEVALLQQQLDGPRSAEGIARLEHWQRMFDQLEDPAKDRLAALVIEHRAQDDPLLQSLEGAGFVERDFTTGLRSVHPGIADVVRRIAQQWRKAKLQAEHEARVREIELDAAERKRMAAIHEEAQARHKHLYGN